MPSEASAVSDLGSCPSLPDAGVEGDLLEIDQPNLFRCDEIVQGVVDVKMKLRLKFGVGLTGSRFTDEVKGGGAKGT